MSPINRPRLVLASGSPRRLEILRSLGLRPEVRPVDLDETPRPLERPEAMVVRLAREKATRAAEGLRGEGMAGSYDVRASEAGEPTEGANATGGGVEDSGAADSGATRTGTAGASVAEPRAVRAGGAGGTDAPPAELTSSHSMHDVPVLVFGADTVVVLEGEIFSKPSDTAEAAQMLSRLSGLTHAVMTGLTLIEPATGRVESGLSVTSVTFSTLAPEQISVYVATGEPMDKAGAYGIQAGAGRFVERIQGSYTNVVGLPVELLGELLARFGLALSDFEHSSRRE